MSDYDKEIPDSFSICCGNFMFQTVMLSLFPSLSKAYVLVFSGYKMYLDYIYYWCFPDETNLGNSVRLKFPCSSLLSLCQEATTCMIFSSVEAIRGFWLSQRRHIVFDKWLF